MVSFRLPTFAFLAGVFVLVTDARVRKTRLYVRASIDATAGFIKWKGASWTKGYGDKVTAMTTLTTKFKTTVSDKKTEVTQTLTIEDILKIKTDKYDETVKVNGEGVSYTDVLECDVDDDMKGDCVLKLDATGDDGDDIKATSTNVNIKQATITAMPKHTLIDEYFGGDDDDTTADKKSSSSFSWR